MAERNKPHFETIVRRFRELRMPAMAEDLLEMESNCELESLSALQILDRLTIDEQTEAYLKERYHIGCHEPVSLLCAYHGESVSSEEVRRYFRHVFSSYENLDCYFPDLVYRNTVTAVLKAFGKTRSS